ncbi:MAG: DEAD/DEAH box helicase family protein, partial [Synechococcales cyanobacterium RM1_1_8]|nr:DEAD/DEAH box helicase family protein [Synechococcales cyanobacterium RM1_1_8]
ENLEQRVGNLDDYVAGQLQINSIPQLHERFGAEQVDALALAFSNLEQNQGFIIGDQTGVGKGRFVAAVIEHTRQQGLIPVFITQDDKLYADMFRDLEDIGVGDLNPLVTNNGLNIPLPNGDDLKTKSSTTHGRLIRALADSGDLGDYDAVFTTYSQLQTVKGRNTPRRELLRQLAPQAVLILDESHNAGGTKQNSQNFGTAANRADFVRELIDDSAGVVYSSATYAKNPYTMTLYAAKSGMGAVATGDELVEMVTSGGVPLQQMLASKLSEAGQYVRRERSYDGIEFGATLAPMDQAMAENLATAMRLVMAFDEARSESVKDLDQTLRAEAKQRGTDSAVGKAGASSTNFTSVMHNLIGQTLLSMKAEAAVQEALNALEKGEKPVIALSNTMGSLIERTAKEQDLSPGDPIELSTANMLHRYLERSREVLIKDYDGQETRHRLEDHELGPGAVAAYETALEFMDSVDWGDNPASPIDYIRARLEQEGYKTGEITGRSHQIDYGPNAEMTYQVRSAAETSSAGKVAVVSGFNSGEIDAVVINRSGSTGISLHASERFADQRPRRMIVAQPDLNIDVFMQTLGRIHRTGQVENPAFTLLMGDIPAEKRPAAVLMRKMASLNANTTAARGSSFDLSQITDFMNVYGDRVATELMAQRPDLHELMGKPLGQLTEETDLEKLDLRETVAKLTGRIPLLPLAQQEEVYALLEEGYNELVAMEEAMGQSKLEAKTLDLDARTTARMAVMPGDGRSPFTEPVYLEVMDVKALRKPMTTLEVTNAVRAEVGLASVTSVENHDRGAVQVQAQAQTQQALEQALAQLPDYRKAYEASVRQSQAYLKLDEEKRETLVEKKLATLEKKLAAQQAQLEDVLREFGPGQSVKLVNQKDEAIYYGVVEQVSHQNSSAAANPINPATWRLQIQMADSMRQIRLPVSKVNRDREADGVRLVAQAETTFGKRDIYHLFDERQSLAREERQIFTGNVIRAFSKYKGSLINFTDSQGQVRQGLMMASGFDILESLDQQPVAMPDAAKALEYLKLKGQEGATRLKAKDEHLTLHWNRETLFLNAAKGKGLGGQYYLDEGLQETAGAEFVSSGNSMKLKVTDEEQALAVLDYIMEDGGWPLMAFEQRQLARELLGVEPPQLEPVAPPVVKPVTVREQSVQQLALEVQMEALASAEGKASTPLPVAEAQGASAEAPSAEMNEAIAPLPVVEAQGAIASPPPAIEQVEAKPPVIDSQGLNSAQAYQLEQLAFEHPAPGTGAADLKEEIRDRLTMGGGTPAQVMAQIDQELDQAEDRQAVQTRQPGPEPQPESPGYSPTLQEMRDWLTDAKINQRPPNYLKRIRELSVEFLAETPMAELPVAQREPEARNPRFVLSEAAQTAMAHDRAASEQRRTPTRQMLLGWYSAARAAGQGAEVLSRIQRLGQEQIAGTEEALKPPGERSLAFKNPEFVLGRADYLGALQSTQVAQPKQQQQPLKRRELEHAA